ncbi:MAG: hypothetical protein ACREJC_13930, partial [Tepidisphaeraceae bacterium]
MTACKFSMFVQALESRLCLTAFADVIDNPFLPMIPGTTYIYRGVDADGNSIRQRVVVTNETKVIQGVTCTVVRDRVFLNGELAEDTRDFFAQDKAGNVWYFGEETREFEDGVVVSTEGSFEAGVDGASAGIIMQARPAVGDEFDEENAPGVAEDHGKVLSLAKGVKTPFASFGECVQIEETTPLEPEALEHKFYAAGFGLVRDQDIAGGGVIRLAEVQLAPQAFDDTIDNPYSPMLPGTVFTYRGVDTDGSSLKNRIVVTNDTIVIQGVTCTVVRDREYVDGELAEDTHDYFAQDKVGNVWYYGEDSREIEDGEVVSTDGSWQAGADGAKAGVIMKAYPSIGDAYRQEIAPGIAEDEARVVGPRSTIRTPFGTFGDCLKTEEFSALDPGDLENKFYAFGVGLVQA